ncbi:MAG: hypothetical protein P4L38_10690, partial [Syntrophaceae bacterium]|nr:hypothetical protein [Syntrophaceae bacterium]
YAQVVQTIGQTKIYPYTALAPQPTPPTQGYYLIEYSENNVPLSYGLTHEHYGQSSSGPVTVGLHLFAIPARVREVPIIAQAKINFPFPYWNQITGTQYQANMLEWEVMAGARPAVWDASFIGLSTFSAGIEAGFRSVTLNADFPNSTSVHAQWQGPFFQVGIYY